jgi:hypothetical protein
MFIDYQSRWINALIVSSLISLFFSLSSVSTLLPLPGYRSLTSHIPTETILQANPSTDRCNPLRYIPELWAAILSLSLYFLVALALTVRE